MQNEARKVSHHDMIHKVGREFLVERSQRLLSIGSLTLATTTRKARVEAELRWRGTRKNEAAGRAGGCLAACIGSDHVEHAPALLYAALDFGELPW